MISVQRYLEISILSLFFRMLNCCHFFTYCRTTVTTVTIVTIGNRSFPDASLYHGWLVIATLSM